MVSSTLHLRDRRDLGPLPGVVQNNQSQVGPSRHQPVCNHVLNSASTICQLVAGSNGRSNRWICAGLERTYRLCQSALVSHLQSAFQSSSGSSNAHHCSSILANSSMVSAIAYRPMDVIEGCNRAITQLQLSNAEQGASVNHVQGLRMCFKTRGFFEETIQLTWREKTEANFDSAWTKLQAWCWQRNTSPFSADLNEVLGLLASQLAEGSNTLSCAHVYKIM